MAPNICLLHPLVADDKKLNRLKVTILNLMSCHSPSEVRTNVKQAVQIVPCDICDVRARNTLAHTKSQEGQATYIPFDNVGIAFNHAFNLYHKSKIHTTSLTIGINSRIKRTEAYQNHEYITMATG